MIGLALVRERFMEVLELNVKPDAGQASRMLRISEEKVKELLAEAIPLIRPRALIIEAFVEEIKGALVRINGVDFQSQVLAKNLGDVHRVFPYIMTIGEELETEAASGGDLLRQYQLETLGDLTLRAAGKALKAVLKNYGLAKATAMSPGSLEDWPITEQAKLFSLLKDGEPVDVHLTESMLMLPRKSLSGIYFPTEIDFQSCRLCPRADCSGRQASFDPAFRKDFGLGKTEPQ